MMPPVFSVLAAAPAVTALIGSSPVRLYPFGEADNTTTRPYVVWQTIFGSPENYLGNTPDIDGFGTQMDVYAKTAEDAREVAETLRDVIEPVAHITAYNGEFRDPITRDYRYSFNVDWLVNR